MQFNGSSQYVELPSGFYTNYNNGMTISGAFNFGNAGSWERIVSLGTTTPGNYEIAIARVGTTQNLEVFIKNASGALLVDQVLTNAITNNAMNYFAWTYDGAVSKVTINGTTWTQSVAAVIPNVVRDTNYINKSVYSGDALNDGPVGRVAIYNRVLTDSELRANYDAMNSTYKFGSTTLGSSTTFTGSSNAGYLNFDASANATIPVQVPDLGSVATVEMWCKLNSSSINGMLFGWNSYDVYETSGMLGYNTGNSDVYGINATQVSNLGLVGNWKHYVFEMRSDVSYTNNKIYVNGVSQVLGKVGSGSEKETSRNFNSGYGTISGWKQGGYQQNMNCSEVNFYNRALTPGEVVQNYNAERGQYGMGTVALSNTIQATGGVVTQVNDGKYIYNVHTFNGSGNLNVTNAGDGTMTAEVLAIGGGGAGGAGTGGGGGAGGLVWIKGYELGNANYAVSIGAGGTNDDILNGTSGGNTTLSGGGRTITALGGGYGGSSEGDGSTAMAVGGGSGGGLQYYNGSNYYYSGQSLQSPNTYDGYKTYSDTGFGNTGGGVLTYTNASGGGGGAGGAGVASGNGGQGMQLNITGTAKYYAAGGGGGHAGTTSINGIGGYHSSPSGTAGAANTGSGGGGGWAHTGGYGGSGGSGVVVIRYIVGLAS